MAFVYVSVAHVQNITYIVTILNKFLELVSGMHCFDETYEWMRLTSHINLKVYLAVSQLCSKQSCYISASAEIKVRVLVTI